MSELIPIHYDNDTPDVSGRDLHEFLEVKEKYTQWFERMCEYGFSEETDYFREIGNRSDGLPGKPRTDHRLTINMAKELCMIQRTERGKQARQYFLQVETAWNTPEAVMARALKMADRQLLDLRQSNQHLLMQVEALEPKAYYYDLILACKELVTITTIAKDYGKSAIWLNQFLHEQGVQFKQGNIWHLYQKYADGGYTQTRTTPILRTDGPDSATHTCWTQKGRRFIYDLLKAEGILPLIEQE